MGEACADVLQPAVLGLAGVGERRRREQGCVDGSGLADGQGADRYAGGHLRDGQQ